MVAISEAVPLVLDLPCWFDAHAHFRQGIITPYLARDHLRMGCYAVLAMPNTNPPVTKVLDTDAGNGRSIESYHDEICRAFGFNLKHVIVPLYITPQTDRRMIAQLRASGGKAAKYYPPNATTNSESGLGMEQLLADSEGKDVLRAMEAEGIILNIHGEQHGVTGEAWLGRYTNAEAQFYRESMPRLRDKFPALRMVAEHISTKDAVEFVTASGTNIAATVTPQHLDIVLGDMVQNWWSHAKCMPIPKFEDDVMAVRAAVMAKDNTKFFAGTDSAPHPAHTKNTDCGCASGCYSGGIAPQLYVAAFEKNGADMTQPEWQRRFQTFLCDLGPAFYDLPRSNETFQLIRTPQTIDIVTVEKFGTLIPLPAGMVKEDPARPNLRQQQILPWSILDRKYV